MGRNGHKGQRGTTRKKWNVLQLRARAGAENMEAFYEHHNVIPLIRAFITDQGIKAQQAAVAAAPLAKD